MSLYKGLDNPYVIFNQLGKYNKRTGYAVGSREEG